MLDIVPLQVLVDARAPALRSIPVFFLTWQELSARSSLSTETGRAPGSARPPFVDKQAEGW